MNNKINAILFLIIMILIQFNDFPIFGDFGTVFRNLIYVFSIPLIFLRIIFAKNNLRSISKLLIILMMVFFIFVFQNIIIYITSDGFGNLIDENLFNLYFNYTVSILTFYLVFVTIKEMKLGKILSIIEFSFILFILFSILDIFNIEIINFFRNDHFDIRLRGITKEPSSYSIFLVSYFSIFLYSIRENPKVKYFIYMIFIVVFTYLNFSKGLLFTTLLSLGLYILLTIKFKLRYISLIILLIFLGFSISPFLDDLIEYITYDFNTFTSFSTRIVMFTSSISGGLSYVFGAGGNYEFVLLDTIPQIINYYKSLNINLNTNELLFIIQTGENLFPKSGFTAHILHFGILALFGYMYYFYDVFKKIINMKDIKILAFSFLFILISNIGYINFLEIPILFIIISMYFKFTDSFQHNIKEKKKGKT